MLEIFLPSQGLKSINLLTLGASFKADTTASKSHKLTFQALKGSNGWNMTYDDP